MGSEPPHVGGYAFKESLMTETVAYIDGLNFYYGAVRNRPELKWLNPLTMLERISTGQYRLGTVLFRAGNAES
jgi:hypothetical protein